MRSPGGGARILHIVPALFGRNGVIGGGERYALELARSMAERTPTRLLSFGDTRFEERLGALRISVAAPTWFVRGQRANPVSPEILTAVAGADVVHCHQQHILATSLASIAGRVLGKRVVVTDLGGGGWDLSSYVNTDRLFHVHLHLSEYSRRVFGHAALPNAQVIWGGVDTDKFKPGPAGLGERVLYVGRLLPHKGVNYLVEGMPPELPLDVAGPAPDRTFLELLESAARGKNVRFHFDVPDEDLASLYQRALCVVLPSVYRTVYGEESLVPELLGQTLLEGMASGLPAICTNVASMPELVEDGVTGFVVPPNDPAALREKIQWLHEHRPQAARMGSAARDRVLQRFTWKPVVERCLSAYGIAGLQA